MSEASASGRPAGAPLRRAAGAVVGVVAAGMSAYHLYVAAFGPPEALVFRGTHLALVIVLTFATMGVWAPDRAAPWRLLDGALIAGGVGSIGYLFARYEYVTNRVPYIDALQPWDYVFGIALILVVLELARRTTGWALPITTLAFLVYALGGEYLPFGLRHRGFPLETVIDQLYLTSDGLFGTPLGVSASYVVVFIVFGALLERSGAGQLFMDFACALTGRARGGPGKVSCVSSALFGTISGSAVANVMVDGWLTIPLMKRTGFNPNFACAVEATASTGGQLMPPVMGAAAFVMAEFLGIPYAQVMVHAIVPALLYYFSIFMAIHFKALRTGLGGIPDHELPRVGQVLGARGYLFVPAVLLAAMMLVGFTAPYAAVWASVATVAVSWLRRPSRMGPRVVAEGLRDGAQLTLSIAATCACAGIIVGVVSLTGVGLKFTSLVVGAGGSSVVPALVLTMVAGIVLGMGMPTTPAYVVQVALLIPALIKLGVLPVAAHMFVLYFAVISAVTPPVALAVYAAVGIGKANLWRTGLEAMKLAAPGFVVPYMFVYGPPLLFVGSPASVALAVASGLVGVTCLAAALQGWFFSGRLRWPESVLLLAAAVGLIKPGWITDLIGLALLATVALTQYVWPVRPAPRGRGEVAAAPRLP